MSTIRIAHRRRFTTISNETVEDARLSFRARGVLLWLLSKPDNWKINSRLIVEYGTEGRDAVIAALKELESAGYLRREKVQQPSGTWVTHTHLYESPSPENQDSVNQDSVFQDSLQVLRTSTENKNARDEAFASFWAGYPRKIGKPSALKAWKKITSDEDLALMLGLSLWAKYWEAAKTEEQFIPHPSRWLNDRRWETPPDTKSPPDPHAPHWDERRGIWLSPGVG